MKTTLNPFENAKRTAQGAGGVSPSVIEEIQEEISVLGSQLTELAGTYSTTEHKTGRKWVDGKDIYEKTFYFENGITFSESGVTVEESTNVSVIINIWVSDGIHGYAPAQGSVESNDLKVFAITGTLSAIKYITYEYTKTGA